MQDAHSEEYLITFKISFLQKFGTSIDFIATIKRC